MTIANVRLHYHSDDKDLQDDPSKTHWGFAEWFDCRPQPTPHELKDPEAKGVNSRLFGIPLRLPTLSG